MLWSWNNYQENLAEVEVSAYRPRPAEFHLHAVRYLQSAVELAQQAKASKGNRGRPWTGPMFHRFPKPLPDSVLPSPPASVWDQEAHDEWIKTLEALVLAEDTPDVGV